MASSGWVAWPEIDRLFDWPHGRAERLARQGILPHYVLPDGSLRFKISEVIDLVERRPSLKKPIAEGRGGPPATNAPTIESSRMPRRSGR